MNEGIVLGRLGALYHGQGRKEEGREMLAKGEALFRELDNKFDLGNLLCQRGQADLLDRDVPAARASLAEAKLLARDTGAGEDSELGTAITELEAGLADTPEA